MGEIFSLAPLRSLVSTARVHAYASVIAAASRLQGAHRPVPLHAEYAKQPLTDDPLYNDSHYFNFFDHDLGIGGFTRIGKLANQNASVGLFVIYRADGEAFLFAQSEFIPRDFAEIRSNTIRYEIIEPLKRLRIQAGGRFLRLRNPRLLSDPTSLYRILSDHDFVDVEADLLFEGWAGVHNSKRLHARGLARRMVDKGFRLKDLAEARKFASEHYEQVGSCRGFLRIGGRELQLQNATGHRDHSWGPRDLTGISAWTWLTMQFRPEIALNLAWFQAGKLDLFGGYIVRRGSNRPLRMHELHTEFEADGITQKSIRLCAEDTSGFRMDVEGKVLNPVPILVADDQTGRTIAFEAMTEYRWQGQKRIGISEYVRRLSAG